MSMKKYISILSAVAALAPATSALAVPFCNFGTSTSTPGPAVTCGPVTGPRVVGHAGFSSSAGTTLLYDIDLKIGSSSAGVPLQADGTSLVPKTGGGFCVQISDQSAGSSPVFGGCSVAVPFSARVYHLTVG